MSKVFAIALVVIKELYRRKDFYVLFVLTALMTVLLGSMSFFNDANIVRYLKEMCLLMIWISALVIAVITAARQIPAERENRTIFPLLAKPVTRAHLVTGKFLGCWLATGLALVVFYAFFVVVAGAREHSWPVVSYGQALWLHWAMLGIVIAFTVLGSIIFAAPSSNATITFILALAILLVGRHLNQVAGGLAEPAGSIVSAVYFLIPHLEFFDLREWIVHDWGVLAWRACGLSTLYALVYVGFFLVAACLVFRRKALN
jgi:ABC-type transport system involved in multi-copper enzyme maturation permease subunit